jgi:hypothetical protein
MIPYNVLAAKDKNLFFYPQFQNLHNIDYWRAAKPVIHINLGIYQ